MLLSRLRVLDLGGAESDGVTRLYADLGADVLKVEPPGGAPARRALPSVGATSVAFALNNANKRSTVLDPSERADTDVFFELVAGADIVVDSGSTGHASAFGTSSLALANRHPHLVALSVTDFGASGPRASWRATDPVLFAMSTALSRSGPTTGQPVLPPYGLASATAAVQAGWAGLVAYFHRMRYGSGDYIDFSRFEAVVQSLDPPFGSEGQAAVGQKRSHQLWRGRPRNQHIYPIFRCLDGFVRVCLLSSRQWRGMRAWLGEPEQFQSPQYDTIAARYADSRELNALMAAMFASRSRAELVREGQARGVPIAALLTPAEALDSQHFRAVGALTDVELSPQAGVAVPVGPFVVDGHHTGYRRAIPAAGSDPPGWGAEPIEPTKPIPAEMVSGQRPFDGLRIIDLGVIVAGGELGRLFADLGAEVIKVESAAYPDGLRQTPPGQAMSRSWALTHRNEYGLGLDLRQPGGAELFGRLVQSADAVFANFKPGTLGALGFSYDELRALNARLVLAESSAFGAGGPWSARMGYGPLVRATTGVTRLWTSGNADDADFYDATTIFPDHVAARLTAIAALAALVNREGSGVGAHVHISQAEAAVNQLAVTYVTDAARSSGLPVTDDPSVHGVYPCAGEDEWCVISVRSDADRATLATTMGCAALPDDRAALISAVADWTSVHDSAAVADLLQRAGVPAAAMYRAVDVLADPQVQFRELFTDLTHPLFASPMPTETGPAPYRHIPRAELRPAPLPGEHTVEVCQKVLALDTEEIDRLIADCVVFTSSGPAH